MEFLYTDTRVEPEIMAGVLESIFPGFEIVFWDRMMQENDFNFDSADNLVFNIEFKEKKKEFGCTISIYRTPENHSQERALFIGRKLSAVLQKRVLVPYTSPAEPLTPV